MWLSGVLLNSIGKCCCFDYGDQDSEIGTVAAGGQQGGASAHTTHHPPPPPLRESGLDRFSSHMLYSNKRVCDLMYGDRVDGYK